MPEVPDQGSMSLYVYYYWKTPLLPDQNSALAYNKLINVDILVKVKPTTEYNQATTIISSVKDSSFSMNIAWSTISTTFDERIVKQFRSN
ncbi:uncharacterized protein PHALS_03131 [Plasmopara halstedii]|uniref:Uncharacterized protein n=1 Tax=Plasmopara halstedii TaxID=4781 RepID=A0A0P1A7G8_PLAHL|nr:uncharacterized protein PHALS_03131 [Plasmopara halstedii]CEG36586.1 hypothetical protein PHALS_03131 [Plasmopara halstedii]|eukprot:XP_024572955.1 hypothetical protein PHALS_03131 [Plasmopara halstedii]